MVQDAEKFKAEDEATKNKVEAKNSLESYCFQMRNTLNEEKIKAVLTEEEKKTIESTSAECLQWLEGNQEAEADVLEAKKKEIEAKLNPIMARVYQANSAAGGDKPHGDVPNGSATDSTDAEMNDLD